MNLFGLTQKFSAFIIRPPRQTYRSSELGPIMFQFKGQVYERSDFTVKNRRGFTLQCSFYQKQHSKQPENRPVVVFLHANSASRVSVKGYLKQVLPNFDVVAFDFCGSGLSEGEYITLGYQQKQDVQAVVQYLIQKHKIRDFILWGRSMGAVTAILYAAKYASETQSNDQKRRTGSQANQNHPNFRIRALVLDSPFANLETLVHEFGASYFPIVPKFLVDSFIADIQKHIKNEVWQRDKTDFDIMKLNPIVQISRIPESVATFFICGKNDTLVPSHHTVDLNRQARQIRIRQIEILEGGHNDFRPEHLKRTIMDFLCAALRIKNRVDDSIQKVFPVKKHKYKQNCVESKNQTDYLQSTQSQANTPRIELPIKNSLFHSSKIVQSRVRQEQTKHDKPKDYEKFFSQGKNKIPTAIPLKSKKDNAPIPAFLRKKFLQHQQAQKQSHEPHPHINNKFSLKSEIQYHNPGPLSHRELSRCDTNPENVTQLNGAIQVPSTARNNCSVPEMDKKSNLNAGLNSYQKYQVHNQPHQRLKNYDATSDYETKSTGFKQFSSRQGTQQSYQKLGNQNMNGLKSLEMVNHVSPRVLQGLQGQDFRPRSTYRSDAPTAQSRFPSTTDHKNRASSEYYEDHSSFQFPTFDQVSEQPRNGKYYASSAQLGSLRGSTYFMKQESQPKSSLSFNQSHISLSMSEGHFRGNGLLFANQNRQFRTHSDVSGIMYASALPSGQGSANYNTHFSKPQNHVPSFLKKKSHFTHISNFKEPFQAPVLTKQFSMPASVSHEQPISRQQTQGNDQFGVRVLWQRKKQWNLYNPILNKTYV